MEQAPTPAKWLVELGGHPFDLDVLARFGLPGGVTFLREGPDTYLRFERPPETPAAEILESARRLITMFHGAASVLGFDLEPIEVRGVHLEKDGRRSLFLFADSAAARARFSASLTVRGADGKKRPSPEAPTARALLVAVANPTVAKVFRILGSSDRSFRDLYVVLEAIAADLGGLRALYAKKWVKEAEIRRLKHTADSVAILGDEARHGDEKTEPPSDPMSLNEARRIVEQLAALWISSKGPGP